MRHHDDDDEEEWRLRMGRLSEWDARIAEALFRARKQPGTHAHPSGKARAWRVAHADGGWRLNDGPQVVFKVAGSVKSRTGARACIRYVARMRRRDVEPVDMFDEFGRQLERSAVFSVLEGWQLAPDRDNLSKAGREHPHGPGERQRLRCIQLWHFVLSISANDADASVLDKLHRAGLATIDALFTGRGHRVLWCMHRDRRGRPHLHVAVKALSLLGKRLRIDRHGDFFDTARTEFASNLSLAGLPAQAGRREDRSDTLARIMTGEEPLRWPKRWRTDLAERAPHWCAASVPMPERTGIEHRAFNLKHIRRA